LSLFIIFTIDLKKGIFIVFVLCSTFLFAQHKGKEWYLLDSLDPKQFSIQDKYIFDSILPLYHNATQDSIKLKQVIFLANTLGDEKIWPRYNSLALKMAEKGGDNKTYLIYKTYALSNIAYQYSTLKNDPRSALAIYEDIYKIQQRLNDLTGLSATTNNIGNIYKKQGNLDKAIEYHMKSMDLKEKNNDKLGVGISYNNLGAIYKDQGDLTSAVNCFSKALKIFERVKDNRQTASALNNLGRIYQNQGDYAKSLENYKRAKMLFDYIGEKQSCASTLQNIGGVYEDMGDIEKALSNYFEAKRFCEDIEDLIGVGNSYIYIAEAYKRLGKQDSSIILLNKACDILSEGDNKYSLTQAFSLLSEIYFEKNELTKAESYATKALQTAKTFGYPSLIRDPSYILYKVYRKQSRTNQSLEMYEQYIKMRDSLDRIENKKGILKQQFKSEYDKKTVADSIAQANLRLIEQNKHEHEIARQRLFTYGGVFGFVLMLIIAFISFRAFKNKQQANKEITQQKHIIEEKQKEILDSINYAKRIQYALLAHAEFLNQHLKDNFILFKPKDIVSGDFYWATSVDSGQNAVGSRFYLAVCDSTGHGVPGAFMSLLNISFLNEAINEKGILEPHEVLNYVRKRLIESISREEQKDGFDGVLVCFDKAKNAITYSSANTSPLLYNGTELLELPYDKMPVGQGERMNSFALHTINYKKGDILYLGTDGYVDQFGGADGKKFKYRRLCETLKQNVGLNLPAQKNVLEITFNDWKGNLDQVDDVLLVGIKL
jgi:serine phosphatase RsbU (regulator of sigma subunit)/lipopolysaccharide biosynthesis regulator YciM